MVKAFRAWGPVALAAGMLIAGPSQAQDLKIGVVNFPLLVQQSPQFEQMNAALETEFAPRQRDIVTMRQELEEKQQRLQRDAEVMSDQERANLEREIRDGARDLERAVNELREDANIRQNEELNKVQRTVLQRVQDYARSEDYDLIVAEALYFDSDLDITEAVLEMLQEEDD
ncbi:MAG TPA: OmpH family outer membrane protein [Gammaproteobacteria bacterium]